ncbi:MAG TPA: nuclear transport factor 2 family protein [Acidimicrobiales bacterium]
MPMTTTTASPSVDGLLAAIAGGGGETVEGLFVADAVLDATVAGGRRHIRGPAAIAAQYGEWFRIPARFEELDRRGTRDGEVVTYLLTWEERGVPHGAHHCHVLTLADDGRIARERFFCGGPWSATELAAMQDEDR